MKNTNFKIIKILMVFAIVNLFSSCSKDEVITENNTTAKDNASTAKLPGDPIIGPDVYYAITTPGTVVWGGGSHSRATLDVNENRTTLSNFDSGAHCVTVSSTEDVYVGGWERQTINVSGSQFPAKVWKNGMPFFTGSASSTPVNCIVTNLDDVYFVTGNEIYQNDQVLYTLTSSLGSCIVHSIYIFNGDIYSCGEITNNGVAVWKNGMLLYSFPSDLAYPNRMLGESIFVDNTGIYTFGQIAGEPKIWKNNFKINLPLDVSGFYYDNNDIYNPYGSGGLRSIVSNGQDILIPSCVLPTITNSAITARIYKMNKSTKAISVHRTYLQSSYSSSFLFSLGNTIYSTVSRSKVYKDNLLLSNKQPAVVINSFFVKGL